MYAYTAYTCGFGSKKFQLSAGPGGKLPLVLLQVVVHIVVVVAKTASIPIAATTTTRDRVRQKTHKATRQMPPLSTIPLCLGNEQVHTALRKARHSTYNAHLSHEVLELPSMLQASFESLFVLLPIIRRKIIIVLLSRRR